MSTRRPPGKMPKPAAPPPPNIKHGWGRHRPYCPYWVDHQDWYDYDWYDYDYDYDWYDYNQYQSQRQLKAIPVPPKAWSDNDADPVSAAYQQGFRDGWRAAMEYAMYSEDSAPDTRGNPPTEPVPPQPPAPPPMPVAG